MDKLQDLYFSDAISDLTEEIHQIAKDKGWWDKDRSDAECIALIHSELSEALEYLRQGGNIKDDKIPELLGVEVELADVIIRVLDLCGARGYRIGDAILSKMVYNSNRPYKHGKKF